jgi:uncharacterized protein (TIRG00374 family)
MNGSDRRRTMLKTLLRFGVSALLIGLVLSRTDLASVGAALAGVSAGLLAAAFASYFVGYLFSVARWRTLLAAHAAPPGFGYLYGSFMVGMFFNQLLPTTVGGDIARYHYTSAGGRGAALSAVVLDRVFGGVSLIIFAGVGLSIVGPETPLPGALVAAIAMTLVVGLLVITAAFMLQQSWSDRLRRWSQRCPARLAALLERLLAAFAAFRGRHDVMLAALLWSALLQCVVITHYYIVGLALGLTIPWQAYVLIVPLALAITMLPISINGVGVREGAFAYLLGVYGVDLHVSIAFAFMIYALMLGQGLLGGLVFALLRARPQGAAKLARSPHVR